MTDQNQLYNSNYVVYDNSTVQQVMEAITYNHRGCVVVIDQHGHVLGVASDGDLRRAIVKGATTITPIDKVLNTDFLVAKKDEIKDEEAFFTEHKNINVLPVVDDNNELVDILVRGGQYKS